MSVVNIKFCLLFCSFFLFSSLAIAEDVDVQISEPILVTATRVSTESQHIAETVTVVTEQDIELLPARDLGEALHYVPGVDVKTSGRFGQATSLSIRGSESRQVLLMVDGIPFNTQLTGQANPTRLPISNIKQIEVIRGGASSVWGSSLGGVINVITKDVGTTKIPQGSFTSSFAEYGTFKNNLEIKGAAGDLGYFASAGYLDTDGVLATSDAEEKKFFGKLAYPLGDLSKIIASFGYSGSEVNYRSPTSSNISNSPTVARYGKMAFEYEGEKSTLSLAVKYNDQNITTNTIKASTQNITFSSINRNLYKGISLKGSVEMLETTSLVWGGDFDWHKLKSNNFLDNAKSLSTQAPYMNVTYSTDRWDVIPGIRHDNNQRFGSQTSPSLGVVYHVPNMKETRLTAKIHRAFNAPPLLWIYNDDPNFFVGASPDLDAERAIVYETGAETKLFEDLTVGLNFYRMDVKDAISLVFEGGAFVQKNFRKFRRQGVELSLDYDLTDEWSLFGAGAFNDVENRITMKTVRDQGIARQSFTLGLNYRNSVGLSSQLIGHYNRWSSAASLQPNDRKFLWDFVLSKEFESICNDIDLTLFFKIHNITNSKYWSSITLPYPERYFEGGFSLAF